VTPEIGILCVAVSVLLFASFALAALKIWLDPSE